MIFKRNLAHLPVIPETTGTPGTLSDPAGKLLLLPVAKSTMPTIRNLVKLSGFISTLLLPCRAGIKYFL